VLVTDLELPGLDGASLARSLRVQDPGLPVLAMHAGKDVDAAWRGPLPDRTAFFEKPIRASELVATATALADARASAAGAAAHEPCPLERPR
jgi:DNA-binding NtrC family response regulator